MGVPVARLIAAPGKLAGINAGLGPKPWPNSAIYIFSFIEPITTKGRFSAKRFRTSSLSVFEPAFRATAKAHGRPKSSSKNFLIPLEYVSFATTAKLAVAKKLTLEAISKFYLREKDIFQKNQKSNNDIFFKPIDIGDNTIPNGNSIMLINFVRLGMFEEAKKLSDSLNGYLNIYKSHMLTSLRAIDFFNNIKNGKNCNEQGCKIDEKN